MDKIRLGICIGDIHFGAFNPKILYDELDKKYIQNIKNYPRLDYVTINGDLYHTGLGFDSDESKYAFKFISNLIYEIHRCFGNGVYFRIIRGTGSHDREQLDNLVPMTQYFSNYVNFRIINKVTVEELYPGFKVLYLPEEYIEDSDEYYKDYFNPTEEYSLICGHGMFEEVSFVKQESESSMKRPPIFNSKLLCSICKGPIIFSHIHTYTEIRKQIYYTSSFSRWCMGEEDAKGYLTVLAKGNKYLVLRNINDMARKYITIDISEYMKYKIELIIKSIEDYYKNEGVHRLRVKCKNTYNYETFKPNVDLLKEYFSGNKSIKIEEINELELKKQEDEIAIIDDYGFIFKDNIDIEERIKLYIKEKYDRDISIDDIKDILYSNTIE